MGYALALALALVLLVPIGWLTLFLMRRPNLVWLGLIWVLGVGPVIVELFSPRAQIDTGLQLITTTVTGPVVWLSRGIQLAFAYLLGLGLLLALQGRKKVSRRGVWLGLSGLLFTAGPILSSFASDGLPKIGLFYLPLLLGVALVMPELPMAQFRSHVRGALNVYLYGSLMAALVAPDWATSPYQSVIPGLTFRLHGVAPQATFLGPIALLYLIFDWGEAKEARNIGHRITQLAAVAVLVLAQSKTTWVIAAIVYLARPWVGQRAPAQVRLFVRGIKVIGLAIVGAVAYAFGTSVLELDVKGLTTFTGRTQIWVDTLRIWTEKPWFGYGPELWSLDHRLSVGGLAYLWVGQAHNQFIQSLGETGTVGFVFLVVYVSVIMFVALRFNIRSQAVSLGVALLMLLRFITETPLRNYSINGSLFFHFVTFMVLLLACRDQTLTSSETMSSDSHFGRKKEMVFDAVS